MKRIAVSLLILFLVVIGFIIINCVITRKDTIKEWNVIKEDYEIINNRAINYANENLGNETTHILIGIGEEAFKDLSVREKDALENIKNGSINKLAYYNLVSNTEDCNITNANKKIYKILKKK